MFHSPCWSTKPVSLRRDALQPLDEAFIADPEKKDRIEFDRLHADIDDQRICKQAQDERQLK
jgi:hypothetical protein